MIDTEKVVSAINYNGNPMELAGGGAVGTEVTLTADATLMDAFAKAIFPSWPNGFEPNSFYVCFWNGLFDGSTPIYSQVGYIAFWTNESGTVNPQANAAQRYRGGWTAVNGITSNWDAHTSIGDKYTWYKLT